MLGDRRVVATGLGVVSPAGSGLDAFWQGMVGEPAHEPKDGVADFDAGAQYDSPKELRRSDRVIALGLAAAAEALDDAGELGLDPRRIGIVFTTGGGVGTFRENVFVHDERGARRVSPFAIPSYMPNGAAAQISMRYGLQGPCECHGTACSSGTNALGNAARLIAAGRCEVVLAGGGEAPINEAVVTGFDRTGGASEQGLCRPFDVDRDGFVVSEGAGLLVLESLEHALERGARIYGEILGHGCTTDAHHITTPDPDGTIAKGALQVALADAGLRPGDIRCYSAHGTGTEFNDSMEANLVAEIFGTDGPAVCALKGSIGHAIDGSGAVEAIAVLLSFVKQTLPASKNHRTLDPSFPPIDVVPDGKSRKWTPAPTVSANFAFGGHNSALVLAPYE